MNPELKEIIEQSLRELTSTLHKQLMDTKLITIDQWNAEIAPKLSNLAMSINEETITARSYRLRNSYYE